MKKILSFRPSQTHCCLCGQPALEYLSLHGRILCPQCEKRILTTEPDDPGYEALMRALRDHFLSPATKAINDSKKASSGRKRQATFPTQTA